MRASSASPWRELADGLLQQDRPELARLERRGALGQALLDTILKRTLGGGSTVAPRSLPGCSPAKSKRAAVSFHARCRSARVMSTLALRFSSLSWRSSPRSGARPHFARKRSAALGDLAAAGGEGVQQAARDAGDLEVAAVLAGAPLDRVAALLELVRERGAVVGAELARGAKDRP